jgi:hypothetical protein
MRIITRSRNACKRARRGCARMRGRVVAGLGSRAFGKPARSGSLLRRSRSSGPRARQSRDSARPRCQFQTDAVQGHHPDGMNRRSPHRGDAIGHARLNRCDVEAFWTIVSYAVVFGVPVGVGYVFYYWFVLIPRRSAAERGD